MADLTPPSPSQSPDNHLASAASKASLTLPAEEKRQRAVVKQTMFLWVLAGGLCIPVAVAWFFWGGTFTDNPWQNIASFVGFLVGTLFTLVLTIENNWGQNKHA